MTAVKKNGRSEMEIVSRITQATIYCIRYEMEDTYV